MSSFRAMSTGKQIRSQKIPPSFSVSTGANSYRDVIPQAHPFAEQDESAIVADMSASKDSWDAISAPAANESTLPSR